MDKADRVWPASDGIGRAIATAFGEEDARVVRLSSPAAARHITGQVIRAHGGMEGRVLW